MGVTAKKFGELTSGEEITLYHSGEWNRRLCRSNGFWSNTCEAVCSR